MFGRPQVSASRGMRTVMVMTLVGVMLIPGSASATAQGADGPLTVYSGRSESLVGPLLERFEAATGIEVAEKYADTAELATLLLEEGDRSPADVFFAQDAGALGAIGDAALFAPLDQDLLDRVEPGLRDADGEWVGVSGRARTVAYSTDEALRLPDSILDYTDPSWSGRIGWAPANGSFQAFVTALRVLEGEEATGEWLRGILANDPVAYPKNTAAVEGVAAGEVDVAFVNHYYLLRLLAEHGDDYPVAQQFFTNGDPGSLMNVAGAGILASSDEPEAAAVLIEFLLSEEAQRYFSETTFEYPLITGVAPDPRLPDLSGIEGPELDLSRLADLKGTVQLLRDVGAID